MIATKKQIYYIVIKKKSQLFKFHQTNININVPSKNSDYKAILSTKQDSKELSSDHDSSFLRKLVRWMWGATWLTNRRNFSTRELQHPLIADASLIKRRHRNPRRMNGVFEDILFPDSCGTRRRLGSLSRESSPSRRDQRGEDGSVFIIPPPRFSCASSSPLSSFADSSSSSSSSCVLVRQKKVPR